MSGESLGSQFWIKAKLEQVKRYHKNSTFLNLRFDSIDQTETQFVFQRYRLVQKFCCSLPATPVIEKTHLASISKFIKTHPGFRTQDFRNSSAAGARSPIFKLESCFLVPGSVLTWIPRKKNQQSIYGSLECVRPKSKSRYICIFDPQGCPN